MKIVFPLFCRLTGKKILFPRVHIRNISPPGRYLFCRAGRCEILRETNIQNGGHKLEEKWLSFVVFANTRT